VCNKTVPDDDFLKIETCCNKTQVFLLVVLTDKIKSTSVWLRYDLMKTEQPASVKEEYSPPLLFTVLLA
jgi:hypothetical protein